MSLSRDLRAPDAEARLCAMHSLLHDPADPPADALDALRDCLGDDRKLVQRRAAECCARLGGRDARVEGLLRRSLAADSPRLRWGAAYALAQMGLFPDEALDVLLEVLGSADRDLRWAAVGLMVRAAVERRRAVIGRLTRACGADSAETRKMAAYCLRDIGAQSEEELRCVTELLFDLNCEVRLAALAAVARLAGGAGTAARLLLPKLGDPDGRVRRAAAATLGRVGERSPDVLAALRRAREGDDPSLRRAAERALRALVSGRP